MHDISNRIADVLLEVEATLRASGQWDENQPSASALDSEQPFCVDTLRFEQWLQWIFLPRMKQIVEQRHPLPENSRIFVYAKEYLRSDDAVTDMLLSQIKRFDELIALQPGEKRH